MATGVVPVVRRISSGIPDLWQRCSTAARDLVAGHYSADSLRIDSLRRIAPSLHQDDRQPKARRATLRQALRTAVAWTKHRIRSALSRTS